VRGGHCKDPRRIITTFSVIFLLVMGTTLPAGSANHDHGKHGKKSSGWTELPMLVTTGGGRGSKTVRLINSQSNTVAVFPSSLEKTGEKEFGWDIQKTAKGFILSPKDGVGGYHWVTVRQESADSVRVASSMIYFSMPSPSPANMLKQVKNRLEIVPNPMPREHSHYRSGETWPFQVRFQGKPLPGKTLTLYSEQGKSTTAVSDAQGIARITIPAEFEIKELAQERTKPQGHRPHRPKANFVLTTTHTADGKQYQTTFNHDYRPGPFFNKSLMTGVGFLFLGMLMATPLLRKPKPNGSRS
jgi:hypothetical protein